MKRNDANGKVLPGALDASRAELLALLLGGSRAAPAAPQRYPSAAAWPLTFGQEGLWFLAELAAASGAYNLPLAFRIAGLLDVQALSVALTELVARHQTLRTRFDLSKGRVVQKVDAAEPFVLAVADAPPDEAALREALRQEAQRAFDLAGEHAFRAVLFRAEDDGVLLLTLHHIICDTHSIGVLLRDLTVLYAAAVDGGDVALPPLAIQYADYALWQRGNVNAAAMNAELEFWKSNLAGHVPADLPLDLPRPELPTFAGGQRLSTLPPPLTAALRDLAQREGVTPFMLLVGLLQLQLACWSGQRDIVIGTPIASRAYPQTEHLIGYFGNTVLIRTGLDERATFRDLLKSVKRSALDAYAHSEVPFERVAAALQPQRDLSRQALFQVMVVLHGSDVPPLLLPGIAVSPLPVERNGSKFDLSLEFFEHDDAFVVRWEYATSVFLPATIARLSREFATLAEAVAQSPDSPLAAWLAASAPPAVDHNDTQVTIDTTRLIPALFEQRVRELPDAVAVIDEVETLSYAQLNVRSNRFAHYLIAQGLGPNSVVGLIFERCCDLVVAMVGTLKAGAAYLPIDTEFPDARIAYLIEDARPQRIVTSAALQARCEAVAGAVPVCRVDGNRIDDAPAGDPPVRAGESDLAYVMYTSGSTGKPKGVETSHGALLNRLLWMQSAYPIGPEDRVLQKTPYTFDVSVWEFLWPLMTGARLVMARPGGHRDAHYLRTVINAQAITVLHFVPSMLAAFLSQSADLSCPTLRHVVCSGEALPGSVVQRFYAVNASARLHNLYGPTEAAIDVTYFECERGVQRANIPIGRPIWNTQIHVLDEALEPVATGAIGELYIGGVGLARGYRHRPDLTAERFVADPFSEREGARLYRTGDLVRRDADGVIEYLGRSDHQVKIRGVRIEIGEIEAALLDLPGVGEGAVVVRERSTGRQLVACLSPVTGASLDAAALRAALRQTLPEAFVPTVFETWPQLPLTANGKLDRTALTKGLSIDEPVATPVAAAVPEDVEARLTRIWSEVLELTTVDPRAGFFDIGGNSILAVAVARRVAEEFGQPFHVTDLFKHVSVRAVGAALAAAAPSRGAPAAERTATPAAATRAAPAAAPRTVMASSRVYPDSVAVIGMSCHFPGAPDIGTLWDNLAAGRESIDFLSRQEGLHAGIPAELLDNPNYVAARSTIADKAAFDAAFFKVTPRDAQLMDPQLRHLLEHSWRAVEDAGYRTSQIADSAVFMSAASSFYHMPAFEQASQVLDRPDEYVAFVWAQPGTLPTTISHKLGLKGASLFVHSNCSSSLTALATAYRHIVGGEAKHALVGAATLLAYSSLGYLHQSGMHFSSDGHLRPFDAAADGMISGEGVAVVLLKNAADAIADGDHIYALLRGIALNNDGADKAGFYAPSAKGQAEVIERVLETTGIDPASISYVEAHGTGTRLGDPIEFGALTDVYRRHTDRRQFCGLGSIKSNFGHLDAAAGLAGCIKVMLSLAHARIPPTLHFTSPNPAIALEASPFHIVSTLTEWPAGDSPRRAAVSSFGIGGTNAHAIFEEWVPTAQAALSGVCLLPLSARSEDRLRVYAGRLASFLTRAANGEAGTAIPSLASIAFTLQLGREPMSQRIALSAASIDEAAAKLQRYADGDASIDGLYRGEVKSQEHGESQLLADDDFRQTIDSWIAKARYAKLLELWVRGFAFDWSRLYRGTRPPRVSLPTYPFLRQDYWLDSTARDQRLRAAKAADAARPVARAAADAARPAVRAAAAPAHTPGVELLTLQEQWAPAAGTPARGQTVQRILCLADDEDTAQRIATEWRRSHAAVEVITASLADGTDAARDQVLRGDSDSYRAVLGDMAARYGSVDAVVYAASLRTPAREDGWREVFALIQGLLAAGLKLQRLLIGAVYTDALSRCHAESWIGLVRSLRVLVPQWAVSLLLQRGAVETPADARQWAQRAWQELRAESAATVRYEGGQRYAVRIEECTFVDGDNGLTAGGVYWITGGAGGLGAAIAQHLLQRYDAKVVVSGRRALDAAQIEQLHQWTHDGGEVLYVAADVTDAAAMRVAVAQAVMRFGHIDGVIHAAGVVTAQTLAQKSADAFAAALSPKVRGTQVLDEVMAGQPLRFICYFSSSAALLGDFGGGDYAMGNRFALAYAQYVAAPPECKRVAIAWPIWEGGMQVGDAASTKLYLQASGQQALTTSQGLALWERALAQPGGHYVISGERARIERALVMHAPLLVEGMPAQGLRERAAAGMARRPELRGFTLEQCVQWELREQIGALLKLEREQIRVQENLADYGFDSITLVQWAQLISRHYAIEVTPAIFFSQTSLEKVVSWLLAQHAPQLEAFYGTEKPAPTLPKAPAAVSQPAVRSAPRVERVDSASADAAEPIAIIGMSGRFAQARTIEEFWKLLVEGREAITEIPPERFDWREAYAAGAIKGKWLATLPGVSEFDPLFFDISPREASAMDPRQRLLLQEAWNALEDAACGRSQLTRQAIGMFVGVEQGDYQALSAGQGTLTSNHDAVLASRLSYFLDLHGPAMALNTSCSSGLVAAHQACLSLRAGECDMAIAAGVNLMLAPYAYVGMTQAGMLSEDGRCYAFDRRANGLVPGEAVVAVVLKRLSRAQADGDPVRAVIVGSGINYDGHTNGITAPSGAAQAQLIGEVYARAGIDARQIGYVVTHGTGTRLGDPVEVNALQQVFGAHTADHGFCALTSTKGNVGHTFAASGLVNLVCAVQALQHRQIPASLHGEERSEYIAWERSAFHVNQRTQPWLSDGPRLAALSAFGMSGTNVHMVVREADAPVEAVESGVATGWLLALSAKSAASLQQRLRDLLELVQSRDWDAASLPSLVHTLLSGREHFAHRCVIVAQDRGHAVHLLEEALRGMRGSGICTGVVPHEFVGQKALERYGEDLLLRLRDGADDEALPALAELHCQGYALPWAVLFGDSPPPRIALPTYPFARDHYWFDEAAAAARQAGAAAPRHPLLHENTSDIDAQRFSSRLTGEEFFLRDHVVLGERVLPGMAYLEMARAAVDAGGGLAPADSRLILRHAVWSRPLIVRDDAVDVHISLYRQGRDEIGYEIYSSAAAGDDTADEGRIVHSQGSAAWMPVEPVPRIDIERLEARCTERLSAVECYERLRAGGLDYGASFRALESVSIGSDESGVDCVVARLNLPEAARRDSDRFVLHPALLDSALHAVVGLARTGSGGDGPLVPYSLEQVRIHEGTRGARYAVLRGTTTAAQLPMLQVELCDADGNVVVALDNLGARPAARHAGEPPSRTVHYGREWSDSPFEEATAVSRREQRHVFLLQPDDADAALYDELAAGLQSVDGVQWERLDFPGAIDERYARYGWHLIERLQAILQDGDAPVLLQLVIEQTPHGELLNGLGALLQTARSENPRVRGQVVGLDGERDVDAWLRRLQQDAASDAEVTRYRAGARQRERGVELTAPQGQPPWKADGVYLVTGGLGGLGRIFAAEILQHAPGAHLVLVGRSSLGDAQRQQLSAWSDEARFDVEYRQADLSQRADVDALIAHIDRRYGRLDGVIHSAGVIRDSFLRNKNSDDYSAVLGPKVHAVAHLDAAIGARPLDLFVLFASTSGVYGNVGQADYAAANAFLDGYARHRRAQVARGERYGRTLSIAWPLWADGRMQMPEAARQRLRERGLVELSAADGIAALYAALATDRARVHLHRVIEAAQQRALTMTSIAEPAVVVPAPPAEPSADAGQRFDQQVLAYLKQALSGTLKLPVDSIEAEAPFERYGLDSILALELTNALERIFGSLSKTLFFEYQTLAALSRYFQKSHRDQLLQLVGAARPAPSSVVAAVPAAAVAAPMRRERASRAVAAAVERLRSGAAARESIAIIGIAGRYPGADTLDAFWDNLKAGRDAITEVPADRWNHDAYFDPQKGTAGKTYGKWGGFIAGVADFDPLFFNISPSEAYGLDPQERLFLQCAYGTLEDAGYTRESLARQSRHGREGSVGVFVGVMYEEYQLYGAQAQTVGHGISLSGSPASIANRVSYFCNFHGPSLAVDTMCSSSLTAIHLACESLLRGQCEAALAGGVNVSVHPNKYFLLAHGRFLASDGRCRSFGEGGDGYVPGEGVGAVLLKPLSHAVADGDRVYAVIRGSSINHGGKTNGFAVPNPVAQGDLIAQALQDSSVDARTISYMEAHGTGTSLGDPIEIRGLVSAFQAQTSDTGFCAIGSVKSNIGHCESAAGIAALTKVLLQLKHGMLVPSLHSETLNPFIDFSSTPFVVQRELAAWPRATAGSGSAMRELPRRAGISSFGAGGSNAHLIIEEYPVAAAPRAVAPEPCLFLLSAKSAEALQRQVEQLLAFTESAADDDLADIAYTLQVGREAMEFRLALIADGIGELRAKLRACAAGETDVPGCQRGELKRNRELLAAFAGDDDLQRAVESWLARGKLEKLLEFWVKGLRMDWNGLYASHESRPRRIALPTYPFERERYWIGLRELGLEPAVAPETAVAVRESVLSQGWQEAPSSGAAATVGSVLIVADRSTHALAQALSSRMARSGIVSSDAEDWRGAVDWSEWDALVDVTGCGEAPADGLAWVEIVQAWVQARTSHGGRALCVTRAGGAALRAGLYVMLQSEYARIRSRHVEVDDVDAAVWIGRVVHELGAQDDAVEVKYRDDRRYRAQLEEIILQASAPELDWAPDGVLWITGGTRGLGLACARHFVRQHGVKRLVLTGRETLPERTQWQARAVQSDATGQKLRALLALQADGVMVEVTSVDLCDEVALKQEMRRLQSFGAIHGVLHCAGMADGQTPAFVRKTVQGMAAVLAPKVAGLETLLRCLRGTSSLRFCVLFSSISAAVPDLASGQADYAMANAYMDAVARREQAGGLPVVSVQWGSWNESGMGEVKSRVYRELGLLSHSDAQGLDWLDRIVGTQRRGVLAPLQVDGSRFEAQRLLRRRAATAARAPAPAVAATPMPAPPSTSPAGSLLPQVENWLREVFAQQLRMPREKVDIETPLPDYGVDSVLLMQVLVPIGAQVNDTLDPSMLYEHQTISAFAYWLVSKYEAALRANLSAGEAAVSIAMDVGPVDIGPVAVQPARAAAVPPQADEALAVVGLSCRFAGADDLSAYWDLLAQGRSAIARVPSSRWGETGADDWAALLEDVNHFDPEYFHVALADARAMDRQALLVLEESLKAWHHAGYAAAELKGTRSGVYLGARGQYHANAASLREAVNPILAMGQNYLAANISQFFDLRGPSLVVDTACSSALVALNMAVQSLRSGEIDAALVGGVSLLNNAGALRLFEQRGILQRGAFHIFDRRAQGAILGEGVGMVVLKRHAQAVADGDRIYALVRAVAVNNDGRTAGPTAPNMHAQKDVMQRALDRSGWHAQDISHIDVNGSGSEITDLLELRAIEAVYRQDRTQLCELGSMKPNIGHPLCAEGIASLIKVVLMLHYGQRVPFLSAHEPMAHYDLDASPFRFTRELRPWGEAPRVAAINSFADGGTNAHVIVEGSVAHAEAWRQPLPLPLLKRVRLPAPPSPTERGDANDVDRKVETGSRSALTVSRRSTSRRAPRPNGETSAPAAMASDIQPTPAQQEPGFWERYA